MASSKALILGINHFGINGLLDFDERKARMFMRVIGNLVKEMACLVLWTGGNPPRSTEFLEASFRNTSSSFRSLFLMDSTFVFVSEYVKYSNTNSSEMPVLRVLPKAVSEILLNYLVLIRPLEVVCAKYLYGHDPTIIDNYRSNIFMVEGHFLLDLFTSIFRKVNRTVMEMDIGVNHHRHLTDTYLKMHYKDSALSNELCILDGQAGHSSLTAVQVYGWTQRDLPGIPTFMAAYFRKVSKVWHSLIGFTVNDAQLVSSSTGNGVRLPSTLVDRGETPFSLIQLRREIRSKIDQRLHPFQALLQNDRSQSVSLDKVVICPKSYDYALQNLKTLMKFKTATFQSIHQKWCMALAIQEDSMMAILNTSGGKTSVAVSSMKFHSHNVYIVIVPTVELVRKWSQDLHSSEINYLQWNSSSGIIGSRGLHQCYLVTPESFESPEFCFFFYQLQFTDRLGYVVIDEAHLLLGWNDFCHGYNNLNLLNACWLCCLMFLSATIPPAMVLTLTEFFNTRFSIIFQASNHPNHCLNVQIGLCMEDIIVDTSQCMTQASKIMVFVPTGAMVDKVDDDFKNYFEHHDHQICMWKHHSHLEAEDRRSIIADWTENLENIHCIFENSALTVGLDLPNVDTILVIGYSYGVLELCQHMGRGGRDYSCDCNIRVYADLIQAEWAVSRNANVQSFIDFVTFQGCYRYKMGLEIDGQGFVCRDDESNLLCSYCSLVDRDTSNVAHEYVAMTEPTNVGQGIRVHCSLMAYYQVEEFIVETLNMKCIHCFLICKSCDHQLASCPYQPCHTCMSVGHLSSACPNVINEIASCHDCCLPLQVDVVSIHATLPSSDCGGLEKIILSIGYNHYETNPAIRAKYPNYKDFLKWMYQIEGGNTNGCFLAANLINESDF
jgi:hypothetical protein